MSAEERQQPSLAGQLARQAARQAAERAAKEAAKQALTKVAAVVGAKVGAVVVVIAVVIIIIVLLIMLLVSVMGAPFQNSAAVWPVPIATDSAGVYQASGWSISSRFGWRDNPGGGGSEFHDGIDLANPQGRCPFGYHCAAPSIFDGQVQYVGWDLAVTDDPSKNGGGMLVIVNNGQADHQFLYAHLEPYRLYVQLQGRIDDDHDRVEYQQYSGYSPIGQGELQPDLSNGGIEMACQNDMPNFIPTRSGGGTVVFLYDRPADCTTTVVWGERGDDWEGWIVDEPGGEGQRASLSWSTPIEVGERAQDVALRFRAHLVPPPPPPTEVPTDTIELTPVPGDTLPTSPPPQAHSGAARPGQGGAESGALLRGTPTPASPLRTGKPRSCETQAGGWVRCTWAFSDIPTERERFAAQPNVWITAAQAYTATHDLHELHQEDDAASGPTVPAAQLLPIGTTLVVPTQTTATSTPTPAQPAAQALGIGGVAVRPQAQATLQLSGRASSSDAVPGQDLNVSFTLASTSAQARTVTLRITFDDQLQIKGAFSATGTTCSFEGQTMTCTMTLPPQTSTTVSAQVVINAATPLGSLLHVAATAGDVEQDQQSAEVFIRVQAPPTATPQPPLNATPTPDILPTPEPLPGGGNPRPSPGPPSDGGNNPGGGPGSTLDCAPRPLVLLADVRAPNPRLVEPAAANFALVRAEILHRTGIDALAVLADVLRQPSFSTNKPGVLNTSWHKAGRAIDLNQGGPFVRVAEGSMFRLYVNNVDVTAIFEAHGWRRIPVQGDTLEWWHYEWHPDGIAWTSAMLQVWDIATLKAAFPTIDWEGIGCVGGSNSGTTDPTIDPQEQEQMCLLGSPSYRSAVETFAGCGPPLRAGDKVYQLDSTIGFVGLTGRTTGPHLHLGLKVRSYQGVYPAVNVCTPDWLQGRVAPADANCWTELADPLSFLPQAPGNGALAGSDASGQTGLQSSTASGMTPTPLIAEGAPYQLPPPNYPNSLVFTPVPDATPVGQYWSPFADGGQYGGGGVGEWFCSVWSGWPWCQ